MKLFLRCSDYCFFFKQKRKRHKIHSFFWFYTMSAHIFTSIFISFYFFLLFCFISIWSVSFWIACRAVILSFCQSSTKKNISCSVHKNEYNTHINWMPKVAQSRSCEDEFVTTSQKSKHFEWFDSLLKALAPQKQWFCERAEDLHCSSDRLEYWNSYWEVEITTSL